MSEKKIEKLRAEGKRSLDEIRKACPFGQTCGTCLIHVREYLRDQENAEEPVTTTDKAS